MLVFSAKNLLVAAQLQVVVGARFAGAGETRRAVAAQRADLSERKGSLIVKIAELAPLVDLYRLAFKRLHQTIGALELVLTLRAQLDAHSHGDDGRSACLLELRRAAAEAQSLDGGRQARRLGKAASCIARGGLDATVGLMEMPVNVALEAIAAREVAVIAAKRASRRWPLQEEEAALYDETEQFGRVAAAEAACLWLAQAWEARPQQRERMTAHGEVAAAERVAAHAALTAAKHRALLGRAERGCWHACVAQEAGLRRARKAAEVAAGGATGLWLNTDHHRAWREAVTALRRGWEFEHVLHEHATERASSSLAERSGFLQRLHAARGEIIARNVVDQPDLGTAHHLNEQLRLQIDSAMCGTSVASLLPTVKGVNAEGACRTATMGALTVVVAERERCAESERRACSSACLFAEQGEEAAEVGREEASQRLANAKQARVGAQAALAGLREQVAALEAAEVAKGGKKKDLIVQTVEGLEKTGKIHGFCTKMMDFVVKMMGFCTKTMDL